MRIWLLILGIVLQAGCSTDTTSALQSDNETRPNIIWLVAEDLSAIELGSYGNAAAQTPNLDRLALEGTRYPNTFSTTPVCAPSRSSFITGMHNTIVVFFSDHGREMPRGKQWVYDGGIHVPLIIRRPDEETPGTVDEQLISNVDISAVSLDLAGIEIPGYFDGRSFLDPGAAKRDYIIATRDRDDEMFDRVRAVRTDRYKYIRNYYPELSWTQFNHYIEQFKDDGQTHYETFGIMRELHAAGQLTDEQALFFAEQKPREELYDIADDPGETRNLAPRGNNRRVFGRVWRSRNQQRLRLSTVRDRDTSGRG